MRRACLLRTMGLLCWAAGCGSPPAEPSTLRTELVYGSDDRVELFQAEELARALGKSVVALGLRSEVLDDAPGAHSLLSPSWGERAGLCPDERFSDQPSFALCTGVAIGSDLVLTAAHCARAAALDDLAVVTGYAYHGTGELELARQGRSHAVQAVLASDSYWDYAWLRVEAGLSPLAPEHLAPAEVSAGTAVFSINHGGGLPAKVDAGGAAYPVNADELLTTLDVFGGASGGPVFSKDGSLIGILTAGSQDYAPSGSDCVKVATSPDSADAANELAVGLGVPLEAICNATPGDSALRASCPHSAAARERLEPGGCTLTPPPARCASVWGVLASCLVLARRVLRRPVRRR